MQETVERVLGRLSEIRRTTIAKLKRRSGKWWFIVGLILFALEEAGRALLTDSTINALIWLGEASWWLANQPVGYAGLFLVGYILVLTGLSWWETRPAAKESVSDKQESKRPSIAEQYDIQKLRAIWKREGHRAVEVLLRLFKDIRHDLQSSEYWTQSLADVEGDLERAVDAFESTLSSSESLETVREDFNEMYARYIDVVEWIGKMREEGDIPDKPGGREFAIRLDGWRNYHAVFSDRLKSLATDPAYDGELSIHHASDHTLEFHKPELYKLLNEAEQVFRARRIIHCDDEADKENGPAFS